MDARDSPSTSPTVRCPHQVIDANVALGLIERAVITRGGTGTRGARRTNIAHEALTLIRVDGEDRPPAARQRDFRILYFSGGTRVTLTLGAAVAFRAAWRADVIRSRGDQITTDATHAVRHVTSVVPDRAVAPTSVAVRRLLHRATRGTGVPHRSLVPRTPGSATGAKRGGPHSR